VVAGVVPAAHLAIDARGGQAIGERRADEQMIEAQPGVAAPGEAEIVPEGVDRLARVQVADRVGPALLEQAGVERADLRREQGIVLPPLGPVDVEVGGHDVVVARQHHGRAAGEEVGGVGEEAVEPGELVVELRSRPRVAVGEVEATDEDARDRGLDVAALRRVGVVG
jgi:hypothetical protein